MSTLKKTDGHQPDAADFSNVPVIPEDDPVLKELDAALEPRIRALQASRQLTEKDFQLRINV